MRVLPRGAVRGSDAEDAVFFAAAYGLVADGWQADVLGDWLLRGAKGVWLARTCGLAVPRQNGKNAIIEIRELFGMVELGEKFLHTAHEVKTARKAFKRLKFFFGEKADDPGARFPELNALVKEIRSTNGQEAILLHAGHCAHRVDADELCDCGEDGGSVEFVARSKGSGRGFTVDVLVCDEAQSLKDEELEALLPTISAAPLGNPQIIFTGTPPNPEKGEAGEVFTRVRDDAGTDRELAWTDFGVTDGPLDQIDLDDLEQLYAVNPALDTGRLQMSVCRTERRRLSRAGYARERLGWWGDPKAVNTAVFGQGGWEGAQLEPGDRPDPTAIGIAVSVDRAFTSIGMIGEWDDGTWLVGAQKRFRGWAGVIAEAKRLKAKYDCSVIVDGAGPTKDYVPQLEEADLDLVITSTDEFVTACSTFHDGIRDGEVTHMGDDELDDAVRVTVQRDVGGDGRWAWGRRKSAGDISMLEAVTLAWFGRDLAYDIGDSVL